MPRVKKIFPSCYFGHADRRFLGPALALHFLILLFLSLCLTFSGLFVGASIGKFSLDILKHSISFVIKVKQSDTLSLISGDIIRKDWSHFASKLPSTTGY